MRKSVTKTLMFVSAVKILFEAINKISETFLGISKKYHTTKNTRIR